MRPFSVVRIWVVGECSISRSESTREMFHFIDDKRWAFKMIFVLVSPERVAFNILAIISMLHQYLNFFIEYDAIFSINYTLESIPS